MKKIVYFIAVCVMSLMVSCEELTDVNINPNGVDPQTVDPNLMMAQFMSSTMTSYLERGFNDKCAGVSQYVQRSGWSSGVNRFDWISAEDWSADYARLKNIQHFYNRAEELEYEMHQGIGLVMRSFIFGLLTDKFGDVPFREALSPVSGGTNIRPAFAPQEEVYKGIIEDLKQANTLLSKSSVEHYTGVPASKATDLFYGFDPVKWRKLTNSLLLRYYMRLSVKLPDYAQAGIKEIVNNPSQYPIFASNGDDALMAYLGTGTGDSWPGNAVFDNSNPPSFGRVQLCAGLRDVLLDFNDPRLACWFNKVVMQIAIDEDPSLPDNYDKIVDGVRHLSRSFLTKNDMAIYNKATWVADRAAGKTLIDTMKYVGIPVAQAVHEGVYYNLNPVTDQGSSNVHVSALADIYKAAKGDLLKARMITYAEVCFILAEAAQKGWTSGAKEWYEKGVKASLDYWKLGNQYDSYIQNSGVAFNSAKAQEQIITQKWIANWTMGVESWCDWRRTGFPKFQFGSAGVRNTMPLRFRYDVNEKNRNLKNYEDAVSKLVETGQSGPEGKDSAWSKIWLIQ